MMYVGATQGDVQGHQEQSPLINSCPSLVSVAQGGSLQEVCKYGMIKDCGLLVNSSRGIIYASNGENFCKRCGRKRKELAEADENRIESVLINCFERQ